MVHDSTLAALEPFSLTLAAVPLTTVTATTASAVAIAAATESSTRLNPFSFFLKMFYSFY
jgi:hypothetical protein